MEIRDHFELIPFGEMSRVAFGRGDVARWSTGKTLRCVFYCLALYCIIRPREEGIDFGLLQCHKAHCKNYMIFNTVDCIDNLRSASQTSECFQLRRVGCSSRVE